MLQEYDVGIYTLSEMYSHFLINICFGIGMRKYVSKFLKHIFLIIFCSRTGKKKTISSLS